jgi:predicted Holliday junction resolvase-like endonuclease
MPETVLYVLVGIVILWVVIIFVMIAKMTGKVRIHEMADESLEKHLREATEWLARHDAGGDAAPGLLERREREQQRIAELRQEIERRRQGR